LGHNLGLKHNGYSDDNCAPNYPSIMSYTRQIPLSGFGTWRLDYSRQDLRDLDERTQASGGTGILESSGIPLSSPQYLSGTTIDVVYGKSGAPTKATLAVGSGGIDFNGANGIQTTPYFGYDINYFPTIKGCDTAGTLSNLQGYDDYDKMDLDFRDGNAIDGIQYTVSISNDIDNSV